MMQSAGVLGLSPAETILAIAGLFSMALNWRFSASMSTIKLDMRSELDKHRDEIGEKLSRLEEGFSRRFVPGDLAAEQRANLLIRVDKCEGEIQKNRDRIHELSNQFQTLMLGPIQQIQSVLTDKARRMVRIEERAQAMDDRIRDFEDELQQVRKTQ